MKKTNLYEYESYISHNLDEYEKQLDKVTLHLQMLKNEITALNKIKMTIDFNVEAKSDGKE